MVHHNRLKPDNTVGKGAVDRKDDAGNRSDAPTVPRLPLVVPGLSVVPRWPLVVPGLPNLPAVPVLPREAPPVRQPPCVAVPPPCVAVLPPYVAVPPPCVAPPPLAPVVQPAPDVAPPPAVAEQPEPAPPVFTRSGRRVRQPKRYDGFVRMVS